MAEVWLASDLTLVGHLSADRHVVYAGAHRLESDG